MSTPSFVLVPSVYKSGTLYAEVPFGGAGDMAVTRSSPATRVNEEGFIELLGRNLLFNSENFLTNWFANQITVQSSTTIFPGPFGNEAVQCSPQPVAGAKSLTSMTPTLLSYNAGVVYTASICVYAGVGQYVQITFPSGPFGALGYANYDIINNSVAFIGGGTDVNRSAKIEPISGTGWVRCIFTATSSGGNSNGIIIASVPNATSARLQSYTPSSGDYFFLSSAQVEIGSTASKYEISTSATNSTPRLDYLQPNGSVGCPALLVEPSAQNGILNSYNISINWSLGAYLSGSYEDVIGVSGNKLTVATGGGGIQASPGRLQANPSPNVALLSGSTYTISFFMKKTGSHTIGGYFGLISGGLIGAGFNVSGSFSSGTFYDTAPTTNRIRRVEQWGTNVYRCSETFTMTANGTFNFFSLAPLASTTGTNNPAVGLGIAFAAPQIELGSVPTSFIPTTTVAVTRGAETINKTGASSLIGQTEGAIYAEVDIRTFANIGMIATISDGTAANRIDVYKYTDSKIYFDRISSTQSAATGLGSATLTAGIFKVAVAYKSGDTTMYINGAQIGATQTQTFTFAALTKINIGVNRADNALFFNDRIRANALYTTRLPNYLLEAETSQIQSYSALASSLSYTVV